MLWQAFTLAVLALGVHGQVSTRSTTRSWRECPVAVDKAPAGGVCFVTRALGESRLAVRQVRGGHPAALPRCTETRHTQKRDSNPSALLLPPETAPATPNAATASPIQAPKRRRSPSMDVSVVSIRLPRGPVLDCGAKRAQAQPTAEEFSSVECMQTLCLAVLWVLF